MERAQKAWWLGSREGDQESLSFFQEPWRWRKKICEYQQVIKHSLLCWKDSLCLWFMKACSTHLTREKSIFYKPSTMRQNALSFQMCENSALDPSFYWLWTMCYYRVFFMLWFILQQCWQITAKPSSSLQSVWLSHCSTIDSVMLPCDPLPCLHCRSGEGLMSSAFGVHSFGLSVWKAGQWCIRTQWEPGKRERAIRVSVMNYGKPSVMQGETWISVGYAVLNP